MPHHDAARRWLERLAPRPVTHTDAVRFSVRARMRCRHALGFDEDVAVAGVEIWRPHR